MLRPTPVALVLAVVAAGSPCSTLLAQSPTDTTLSALVEGARIRTNGPAIRDEVGLSVGDVLERGLMSILVRPPAEGVVVEATPGSLRFAESERTRLIEVPWSGVDYVDVYEGRSAGLGFLQGAGGGALGGLAIWGLIELLWIAADNPVVDDPEYLIGISAGAGALLGAATLGDQWGRVYPRGN